MFKKIILFSVFIMFNFSCSAMTNFDENNSNSEDCTNNVDDDGDGFVDCDDQDCKTDSACTVNSEDCTNGVDDDGDGDVDCDDSDCFTDTVNCPGMQEVCNNGVDDNNDGLIDCFDPMCINSSECMGREICDNQTDDNGNGLIDCLEPDCEGHPHCSIYGENICDDGVDNDGDGLVDCEDQECKYDQMCDFPGEGNCNDGIDNDNDGKIDCEDPECYTSSNCATNETDCSNGIDDDNNAMWDCTDPACFDTSDCSANCLPLDSYWGNSNQGGCQGSNMCSFAIVGNNPDMHVEPHCMGGVGDSYYDDPFPMCADGAVNVGNACAVVCSNNANENMWECPGYQYGNAEYNGYCKYNKIFPTFQRSGNLSYCTLQKVDGNDCDPFTSSDCPDRMICKIDGFFDTPDGFLQFFKYGTYCVSDFNGQLSRGSQCNSDEECSGSLSCIYKGSEAFGFCKQPCNMNVVPNGGCPNNEVCLVDTASAMGDSNLGICN